MPRILIADDDAHIRDVIAVALETSGYALDQARNGTEAICKVETENFDLVILDVGMPEQNGFDVCREVRRSSDVPIIFLTAHSDEVDKVLGLELGGDDYVTKPFSPRELVARIRTVLKRARNTAASVGSMSRGSLVLKQDQHRCFWETTEIELTASEFSLLLALLQRPDAVQSKSQLIDKVYGNNPHVSDRTLDSHIRNIRAKLSRAGCGNAIVTVHGVGFRLGACS